MTAEELATLLRSTYERTPRGNKTLAIHLWAIEYADELNEYTGKVGEVVLLAGVGDWVAAINDARKLAKHVTLDGGHQQRNGNGATMFWEYRLIRLRPLEPDLGAEQFDYRYTEQELINLSAYGWEVVSIAPAGGEWVALLKRPTEELVTVDCNAVYSSTSP